MKSRNRSNSVLPTGKCRHLKALNVDAHTGAVRFSGKWRKRCECCVALYIGGALRRGASSEEIARSVSFRNSCKHTKSENEGCLTCFAAVEKIVKRVWSHNEPDDALKLLAKANKLRQVNSNLGTQSAEAAAVEAQA